MIEINCVATFFWNANGLLSKLFILYDFLRNNRIQIACINETHLAPDDILHRDADYIIYRLDRDTLNERRSGGVAIIVHRTIHHKLLPRPHTKLLEAISVEVFPTTRNKCRLTSVYMPGDATNAEINQY